MAIGFNSAGVRRMDEEVESHNRQLENSSPAPSSLERAESVRNIARVMSRESGISIGDPINGPSPELDPSSPRFNYGKWARSMLNVRSQDPTSHKPRTAGFAFKDLTVYGQGQGTTYQRTIGNTVLSIIDAVKNKINPGTPRTILDNFAGVVNPGEMLVVLGPPGSGCTTFLKTISGEMNGIWLKENSHINYQGITSKQMHNNFRGEAIYTAEVDVHFPQLTVGQTLEFAARCRAPRVPPGGLTQKQYASHMKDVVMAMYGIKKVENTIVGNDFIRGVSGGERKRVTIAEAALSGAPLQCWDNSTRGLDSANAIEFCKNLRVSSDVNEVTSCVAIYQAPQAAYDYFHKVTVLYDGEQIYFGRATDAKQYFINLGFECPERQTVPDFLTSMTSSLERVIRKGYESTAPQTPKEFADCWRSSDEYKRLMLEIDNFDSQNEFHSEALEKFVESRQTDQAKMQRDASPYTLSYTQQVKLTFTRYIWRIRSDPAIQVMQVLLNSFMALIIASVFFNLQMTTASLFQRGALLFFAVLLNAFQSVLEILTLYAQRPIVEKHSRYAFYHPSAEAWASSFADLPTKFFTAVGFNVVIYFMTNLKREAGAFFFFFLITFSTTLCMSMFFRTLASLSRSLPEALVPAAIINTMLAIYTGFVIPIDYMRGWARWFNYVNLLGYAFESLMVNEFHGRKYTCSQWIPSGPGYEDVDGTSRICNAVSAVAGQDVIDGQVYIESAYNYKHSHKWRNWGILWAFFIGLTVIYIISAELVQAKKSKGEVLVFPRKRLRKMFKSGDIEGGSADGKVAGGHSATGGEAKIQAHKSIFHWEDLVYRVPAKKDAQALAKAAKAADAEKGITQPETKPAAKSDNMKQILSSVDGWVKPGTLTALMGVSGAGKTTLLDVLATRTTTGVISGRVFVDGQPLNSAFQRKTGYVQQQDLHLETSTVREALEFSAIIRQPRDVSRADKIAYVDEVVKMLDMQEYEHAVVGLPGEGLNVEQRKRLTIGVELAAKPELLLFLDEPTSGLDSQTSWAICDLMKKLTDAGQAILCTVHQPSAMLFSRFDRLLFLASGGRTVYFGDIGINSETLTDYFHRNGARMCEPAENPAEYILDVTGGAPGSFTDINWPEVWKSSAEYRNVKAHLAQLRQSPAPIETVVSPFDKYEFSAPFSVQLFEVLKRVFQQYWRTPEYIFSKFALCLLLSLIIGFSFYKADNTIQGLTNQMFSIFMIFLLFGYLLQQRLPRFVVQRDLYEARERPSKAYSWKAFLIAQILVELPYTLLMSVVVFVCWYYPVGFYRNAEATDTVNERSGLMFLYVLMFLLFVSTFSDLVIAGMDTVEGAANIANAIFSMCLIFCGVLATPETMPRFWIWMYRISPFTYVASSMMSVGLAETEVVCADNEILYFDSVPGSTCQEYLGDYASATSGRILNPDSTDQCAYCPTSNTDFFLSSIRARYSERWRNFGILWAYIIFNVAAAIFLYWMFRVRTKQSKMEVDVSRPTTEVGDKQQEKMSVDRVSVREVSTDGPAA